MRRVLAALGCWLLGSAAAAAAVLLHQLGWGLLLAAGAVLVTVLALPPGWATRLPFAAAFLVVVLRLGGSGPGGDLLVPPGVNGYLLVALGAVLVLLALVTLPARGPSGDRPPNDPPLDSGGRGPRP